MLDDKEAALAKELRARGQVAQAIILETGTTKLHWKALTDCREAGIKPSEFVDALVSNTLATVHSVCKMVNDPGFTEVIQTNLILRILDGIDKIGK